MATKDFNTDHLRGKAKTVANGVVKFLTERYGAAPDGGGCKAFYSPREWKDRGEDYGTDSVLVLCHDGGDLSDLCGGYSNPKTEAAFHDYLRREHGVWVERCTGWYSAVYKV